MALVSPCIFLNLLVAKAVNVKMNWRSRTETSILVAATVITGCHGLHGASKHDGAMGLERGAVVGSGFVHTTFYRWTPNSEASPQAQPLFVYFEGDGRPWNSSGTAPRRNPDPRRALVVELAATQEGDVAVLGRPCYFDREHDAGCNADLWTDARYSERVVASMTAALQRLAQLHQPRSLVLVGYSGGGSLALLVAERAPAVRAVVTVAANVDLDAWVRYHGYRPLAGSLDPLKARGVAPGCEIHIAAERDSVVPLEQSRQAAARRPASQLWVEPQADHACCWTRRWPELMARIQHQLQSSHCFADRS
jgi:dienelactone hydrolase